MRYPDIALRHDMTGSETAKILRHAAASGYFMNLADSVSEIRKSTAPPEIPKKSAYAKHFLMIFCTSPPFAAAPSAQSRIAAKLIPETANVIPKLQTDRMSWYFPIMTEPADFVIRIFSHTPQSPVISAVREMAKPFIIKSFIFFIESVPK